MDIIRTIYLDDSIIVIGCNSDTDCPATDPVCSEYGFCQCSCYQPGDQECWGVVGQDLGLVGGTKSVGVGTAETKGKIILLRWGREQKCWVAEGPRVISGD